MKKAKAQTSPSAPSVFAYLDYRVFLRDWYAWAKQNKRGFSYRSFALKAGTPPSLLKEIIDGKRNLTENSAAKLLLGLALTSMQAEYFKWMIRFLNANSSAEMREAFQNLSSFRTRAKLALLEADKFEYLSQWYQVAIRELVAKPGFKADARWLGQALQPNIPEASAQRALDLLNRLRLLKQDKDGNWTVVDRLITTADVVHSLAAREYHRQMMELAIQSLAEIPLQNRDISGLTISCSQKMFARIRERLRICRDEILAMVQDEAEDPTTVLQLHIALFPLSREASEGVQQ